ncbi:MAG: DUF1801 domain-containing protein [Eggerthellaceae bacterium]|nr:DUF1801 domain-containing protein [Eggerthellaceae bacterium]
MDQKATNSEALTVDGYIAGQPEEVRALLRAVRETIVANAPEAVERIAWRMPTYWQGENLIHFAAFKRHIGLYPGREAVAHFASELEGYTTAKGTVQLPLSKPIDHGLIAAIVRWRVEQATERQARTQ